VKLLRRRFLHLAAGAAILPAASRLAGAQSAYPTRTVRVIVGFPPGGVSDISARLVAQSLSERLGQQFIVENRPGAGGNLATDAVVKAAPDGYTLLLTGNNDGLNASLYDNLSFNYIRDIAPVGGFCSGMGVIVVDPSSAMKTVSDLISYAKANPGKMSVGSGGVGSSSHVFLELFKALAGVDMVHVPYRGEGPAITDLLGGQLQAVFPTMPPAIEYIRSGRLRALAVTAERRAEFLPAVPTVAEIVPGYEGSFWIGIGAPKNTPREIIEKLNGEINAGVADARMKQRMTELGATGFAISPADFGRFIVEYTDKWGKVIRQANIKL
jgi:tripartite-type tricarboxylate transporter receptor subunit TctC